MIIRRKLFSESSKEDRTIRISHQKCFSLNYNSLFPRVSKNLDIDDSEGCIPEPIVKNILTNWKTTILPKIWEDMKPIKPKFTEKDLETSITLISVYTNVWRGKTYVSLGFVPGPKLKDYFGIGFSWDLEFDGETGKYLGLEEGD